MCVLHGRCRFKKAGSKGVPCVIPETFVRSMWSNEQGLCAYVLMKFPRFAAIFVVLACISSAVFAANPVQASPSEPPILPQSFGGWQMKGTASSSTDAAKADSANSAVLKEYRFTDVEMATYVRDDGRTLKVRAARFADASGAFGAYTFYLNPAMTRMDIKEQGSSSGQRVLFFRGQILVDASFSEESPMSGTQLRELSAALPQAKGNNANLPSFIEFLPHRDYVANTQKYVMGPIALAAVESSVSAEQVDFGASSEVSTAHYSTATGDATLILISYPTPQLAIEHRRRINAAHQLPEPQSGDPSITCAAEFCDKRSGPLVVLAVGGISQDDAKSLLGSVNYEASVTWNTPSGNKDVHDLYLLVRNVAIMCGVLGGLAIVAGIAFGGIRILMKKLYPDRVFDRPEQMEFISLHLTETAVKGAGPNGTEGHGGVS